jgi:hypothetical protein
MAPVVVHSDDAFLTRIAITLTATGRRQLTTERRGREGGRIDLLYLY